MTDPAHEKFVGARLNVRPNRPEQALIDLFDVAAMPFMYVGNFKVWIGGKNPDFIWEDRRLIVEYFGAHWHQEPGQASDRVSHFASFGYPAYVVLESDFKHDQEGVLAAIKVWSESYRWR